MTKILVADDDESIRMLYELELTEEGYEVVTTGDGSRLMELIERERPDLIVLDIRMGQLNDMDLLREIRPTYPELVVVVCTSYPIPENDQLTTYSYLPKSSDLSQLKRKIRMTVERRRTGTGQKPAYSSGADDRPDGAGGNLFQPTVRGRMLA